MSRIRVLALFLMLAGPAAARAHHGVAAVGVGGPEGPGAALETSSPLPLAQRTLFAMIKSEAVPFQQRAVADPENKTFSLFDTLGVGYGILPWLSAYAFIPYNVKSADTLGTNAGFGNPNLMLAAGLKWDEGLRPVPEKESLDELMDWHFGAWVSGTLPLGPTTARDDLGGYFAPDMQTGFGEPSLGAGLSIMKQVSEPLTWLAEVSHQRFLAHTYPFTRYRFGAETRANTALVWRVHGSGAFRLDLCGELNGLHLERDREQDGTGAMVPLQASGGDILYAGGGLRATWGTVSLGLGVRRAAWKDLNEESEQQGSEGLELLRAALTLGWSTRL
ncbi:MAG: hypothetical protein QM767_19280 [Anaeromyxobacter sp.]